MTDIKNIFDVTGRAMSAQMTRLNTIASNLANANSVSSTPEGAYRPLRAVFAAEYANTLSDTGLATVDVEDVVTLEREATAVYSPDHPMANEDGYIFKAAISTDEEMVEMIEASRQYQNNLEVVSTLRALMARTVTMGK